MEGEGYVLDLATRRSLAAFAVDFYVMIEEVEKTRMP